VQSAAEYRAMCLQTYRLAFEALQRRVASEKADKPFAIVLDLDETVFDNSAYQSGTFKADMTFSPKTWEVWEKRHGDEVGAVPGSVDFLEKVAKMEKPAVSAYFITNRRERGAALQVLNRLLVSPAAKAGLDDRLKERTNGPDKGGRRALVEKTHKVLMWIGDSLADCSSEFDPGTLLKDKNTFPQQVKAIEARRDLVEKNKDRFGYDWFILPNPMYGDWADVLGDEPARHLRDTRFKAAQ
jgi:acid phosphatase